MTDHTGDMPPDAGSDRNGGSGVFSVLVPVYNEEEGILDTLTDLQERLAALAEESEIIVIDDGSTDRTRALLEGFPGTAATAPH
jgi:cellulose synthase/poly-beta-1,6-N-acetylglucosamine synthase-like glycosyltransferase